MIRNNLKKESNDFHTNFYDKLHYNDTHNDIIESNFDESDLSKFFVEYEIDCSNYVLSHNFGKMKIIFNL